MIIATWNARDVLGACLASVESQELEGGFETIVVDNASTDGTAELLREHAGRVQVIANDHNAYYAGANNLAANRARGEILIFLNSDTELTAPDTLERLTRAVEAPGVGIAGPLLLNPDGTLQPSCAADPTIVNTLLLSTGAWRLVPARLRARILPQLWPHDRPIDTDWVKGAALAVRADTFRETGGFWPLLYGEEQDLARRVRDRGLRVRFDNSARIVHVGNYSLAQRQSDRERAGRVATAELTFMATHYRRWHAAAIRAVAWAGHAVRALLHFVLGNRPKARVHRSMARTYATGPPS